MYRNIYAKRLLEKTSLSIVILVILGTISFSQKTWSAGAAIQFSVALSTPATYQNTILPSGRYRVSVENKEGNCQLLFSPVEKGEAAKDISIYGTCGVDNSKELAKPVINVNELKEAKSLLIYFETPYERKRSSFFVIVRLSQN
jgi:hypothetical protein